MINYDREIADKTDQLFMMMDSLQVEIDMHNQEIEEQTMYEDPFVPDENYQRQQDELQTLVDENNVYDDQTQYYADGGEIDRDYNRYLRTLPRNQRNEDPDFNMYRYWELNGKPKNFRQAKQKGMFTWDRKDRSYHAGSVAYDQDNDRYEFVKSPNHPSVDMELLQYFNSDEMSNFRKEWKLNMDTNPYLYERRKEGDDNLFAAGGRVNLFREAGPVIKPTWNQFQKQYLDDFTRQNEEFLKQLEGVRQHNLTYGENDYYDWQSFGNEPTYKFTLPSGLKVYTAPSTQLSQIYPKGKFIEDNYYVVPNGYGQYSTIPKNGYVAKAIDYYLGNKPSGELEGADELRRQLNQITVQQSDNTSIYNTSAPTLTKPTTFSSTYPDNRYAGASIGPDNRTAYEREIARNRGELELWNQNVYQPRRELEQKIASLFDWVDPLRHAGNIANIMNGEYNNYVEGMSSPKNHGVWSLLGPEGNSFANNYPLLDFTGNLVAGYFGNKATPIISRNARIASNFAKDVNKNLAYMALNSTDMSNPLPYMLNSAMEFRPWSPRSRARLNYLLKGQEGKYRTFNDFIKDGLDYYGDEYYASFGMPGDFRLNSRGMTNVGEPKHSLIYGEPLNSKVYKYIGQGEDYFGIHKDYISKNPQYKHAKVYEMDVRHSGGTPVDEAFINENAVNRTVVGNTANFTSTVEDLLGGDYKYNAAGNLMEIVKLKDGRIAVRRQDMYKFNPKDYGNRYGIKSIFGKLGLKYIDKMTSKNVPIVRENWTMFDNVQDVINAYGRNVGLEGVGKRQLNPNLQKFYDFVDPENKYFHPKLRLGL